MLGHIFLASCLFMMTSCWRIDVSETNVTLQYSSNVMLECRNDDNNPNIVDITILSILKRKPNNRFITVAKVTPRYNYSLYDANVTGKLHTSFDAFIKLEFPLATHETIGQFVCKVYGFDVGDNLIHVQTSPVKISEKIATYKDIQKDLRQFKSQMKAEHADYEKSTKLLTDRVISQMKAEHVDYGKSTKLLTDRVNNIDNDHLKLAKSLETKLKTVIEETISDEMNNITKKIQLVENDLLKVTGKQRQVIKDIKHIQNKPSEVWPTGKYSLLKSKDGCPYSPTFVWQLGSVRHSTKPGRQNKDRKPSNSHLPKNTLQHYTNTGKHYVYLAMCSKNATTEGQDWPKGRYCLLFYRSSCPTGLSGGYMWFGRYDDGSIKDSVYNQPRIDGTDKKTYHNYCCRKDGEASQPIELPTKDPFYLFRFGGQCQEVKGMDTYPDWIVLDTNKQYDEYYSGGNHPDGHLKPVKLELCYYKPRV